MPSEDDLLAAYRAQRGPDTAAQERLRDRLDALGPPQAASETEVVPLAHASWTRRGAAVGGAIAALAAAVALGWWIRGDAATSQPARDGSLAADQAVVPQPQGTATRAMDRATKPRHPAVAPQPVPPPLAEPLPLEEPPAEAPPARSAASARPRPERAPTPAPPSAAAPPTEAPSAADSLAAEAARIGQARAALAGGHPATALALLANYDKTFPAATLAEEADAIRTMARCRTSASPGVLGRTFALRNPKSIFAKQVRDACPEHALPTAPEKSKTP